jgi:glycosyltransferase involved in cell wall biosynthesis
MTRSGWIVCQIGAREHYAVARALHRRELLQELITDVWVGGESLLARMPGPFGARLRGRFEPSLRTANVSPMMSPVDWLRQGLSPQRISLAAIVRHNDRFQEKAARRLQAVVAGGAHRQAAVVFSYSYAARGVFEVAKMAGLTTVLGQIDGGPAERELVAQVSRRHGQAHEPALAPEYWEGWRAECGLADRIVVNSRWAKTLLAKAGIDAGKVVVVPVMHETGETRGSLRPYPAAFNANRPLRALFLGTLTVRKGIIELLQAAALLQDSPIEFHLVGSDVHHLANSAGELPNVRWSGAVPRSQVDRYYDDADVFVLPTHSDGFALTQLEAQTHGLPVVATPFCGDVVADGENGILLPEVSAAAIAQALTDLVQHPHKLAAMSLAALQTKKRFSIEAVTPALLSVCDSVAAR